MPKRKIVRLFTWEGGHFDDPNTYVVESGVRIVEQGIPMVENT